MKKRIILLIVLGCTAALRVQAQDVSKLYGKVNPSVVTITIEETEIVTDRATRTKSAVTMQGLGSGVVISEDGEIMTAAHVVEAAENLQVTFLNGDVVPAKVITSNKDADVALIKLLWIPKNMIVAAVANSDEVKIGNQVIVIGAPLGLSHSLSVGHISGRMKSPEMSDKFTNSEFFQTDASINHGNSGGPMFNMKGEVIGIVSFILSQSGGFEGIGFAVTSNVAKHELIGAQPFWTGITFEQMSGQVAKIFNLPQEMGLLVQKVVTNSPADLAGIKPGLYQMDLEGNEVLVGGDIILSFGGFKIEPSINAEKLRQVVGNAQPGSSIPIQILRGGVVMDLVLIVPDK